MTIQRENYSISSVIQATIFLFLPLFSAASSAMEPSDLGMPANFARFHDFTERTSELAMRSMALVGIRYKYGGNSPEHGMDCSGLVGYVFKETWGMSLPRTTGEISLLGQRVDTRDLRPGDLVFYNTLKRAFSHVGIYLGDNKFIHSPSHGGEVRIERMDVNYWEKRFNGARRIADPNQSMIVEQRAW